MKEQFREIAIRGAARDVIDAANKILAEYEQKVTLRQLYYQFVARDLLGDLGFAVDPETGSTNSQKSYNKLAGIISDGRLAGLIDWDSIEDRGRAPTSWIEYDGPVDMVESALRRYRLPRWKDQDYYVELWVEKQALAGVLEPLAYEAHVTLLLTRLIRAAFRTVIDGDRMQTIKSREEKHKEELRRSARELADRLAEEDSDAE